MFMSSGGLFRRTWRLVTGNQKKKVSSPGRREFVRDRFDHDRTDEASQLIASIGGDFHQGDIAEIETSDPTFWKIDDFTLNFEIGAIARAEIPDAVGLFSFTIALTSYRNDYLDRTEPEVSYEIIADGLGTWTAFSARPAGEFWLIEGESNLVARAALNPLGTSYTDCSFYCGPSLGESPWMLRLVEIGGYRIAFHCEVLPIDRVKFWRHQSST